MRFQIQQWRNEQHHKQFRVERDVREKRQLRCQRTQRDLYKRRGNLGNETADKGRQHNRGDNTYNQFEYRQRASFARIFQTLPAYQEVFMGVFRLLLHVNGTV